MIRFATTFVLMSMLAGCAATTADSEDQSASLSASPASVRTPTALSGDYRFDGNVKAVGRLTVDVVDTRSADAETRLQSLRAEGAACTLVISNTYRCTKMHSAGDVPSTSLDDLGESNRDLFASFGAVTSSPVIVSQGDSLVEWQISQRGTSSVGDFTSYRYLEMSGGLVKIILPGVTASQSLELIVEGDHLGKWDSRRKSEGRWRWHEDMAIVAIEK
jgi:hypothetical protein